MSRSLSLYCVAAVAMMAGCVSSSSSNTARTATEQLLISNAVDQVLDRTDFSGFGGQKVFLEEKYLDAVDKSYIIGSIRHRMLRAGAELVTAADGSDITVEIRSGSVGTDNSEAFVGVPEVVLPGVVTLPEVRVLTRNSQRAIAKIGLVAYDTKVRQLLGEGGGVSVAKADDSNWYLMGIGPYRTGSVTYELDNAARASGIPRHSALPTQIAFDGPAANGATQYASTRQAAHAEPARIAQPTSQGEANPFEASDIRFTSATELTE